ncbi:MAG TPA: tetratricopeptide repeat protein [Polyangiaceae bacterium]
MVFRFEKSRSAPAEAARAKAAAGDCKAALDFFDEALRHSIDPTLYRDRGVCHEKLGDIYPAIDDYRAYLSQEPDATDADKFRQRLQDLLKDASQDMSMSKVGGGGSFDSEMAGGMTDGSTPANPKKSEEKENKSDDKTDKVDSEDAGKPLSTIEHDENRDAEANKSPLRLGRGFVLGAFLDPRYVFNRYDFQFGQGVGVKLGISLSAVSTIALELGYMNQLSTGTASTKDGFTANFGYEARVPLDRWADNQLLFGAAGGYENITDGSLGQTYASFTARGRAGYRHVFGPAFALDFVLEGGLMGTFPEDAPAGTSNFELGGFIGGHVVVSVGF